MKIKWNFRNVMALVYVITFISWLAAVLFFVLPLVLHSPESLDPMMAMAAGLGIGGVTQFFIVIGTLIYQFYFRKREEQETSVTTPPVSGAGG